jgi:hypothetical protein
VQVGGTYSNLVPGLRVTFNSDSTFLYETKAQHPIFYRWEDFSEKGRWTVSGDTITLNPGLAKKIFVESAFTEQQDPGELNLLLTFNHIRRYFDTNENIIKADTIQIDRLDYTFNEYKKKKQTRVALHPTTRCTFAGYIPPEIITKSRSISVKRPAIPLQSIFVGCYGLQGTKEFIIKNPDANHLTLNVYSNYYQDGQIRQMKFLIKNEKTLYTKQKGNGEFEKDSFWTGSGARLTKKKGGSLPVRSL